MNKKIWCALLLSLVVVLGAGCGQKPLEQGSEQPTPSNQEVDQEAAVDVTASNTGAESNAAGEGNSEVQQTVEPPEKSSQEDMKKLNIEAYYTDPEQMDLKKVQKEISFKNDDDKYKAAFVALQQSDDPNLVPLWVKMELKSIEIKDGALTIDIHMPDEARLGAGGEQYALDALTNTFFQFKEVQSIELLVDGKKEESLMGHVDLEHPFKRHN